MDDSSTSGEEDLSSDYSGTSEATDTEDSGIYSEEENEEDEDGEAKAHPSPGNSLKDHQEETQEAPSTPKAGGANEVSNEVDQLTPSTSRLASLASGFRQKKFEEDASSGSSTSDDDGDEGEQDDGSQGSNGDDQPEPGALLTKEEEEQADNVQKAAEEGEWTKKATDHPPAIEKSDEIKPALNKELSTNWMKFEEEAWGPSKQDLLLPANEEEALEDTSEHENTNGKHFQTQTQSELEAHEPGNASGELKDSPPPVAGSSESTPGPAMSPRRVNGGSAQSANVAFWGDDEAGSDEDAVDDAAIGKALETNSPKKANVEKKKKKENGKTARQQRQQEQGQPGEKGWAGKMIGNALGFVAQKLPFSKDDNDAIAMNEDNVLEAVEDEMPEFHDKPKNVEASGIMQDCSALSVGSEPGHIHANYDDTFERRARNNTVSEEPSNNESMTDFSADRFDQDLPNDKFKNMQPESGTENHIKFAKEGENHSPVMPLFDLFIDMPHPAATESPTVTPAIVIGSSSEDESDRDVEDDIRGSIEQITSLAFPEYDGSISQATEGSASGKQNGEKLMLEAPGFQHYTFTLKLRSGSLVYGHVRRYLPTRDDALSRYDVGRRTGRVFIIFSRFPGGDDFFASILR
jgi:hypothetical protein